MAASEVVISGILYTGKSGAGTPVTLVGIAGYSNLTIWGGPGPEQPPSGPPGYPDIGLPPFPAHPIVPPGQPPSGAPPLPQFPIWGPPGVVLPPGSGYPPVAGHPLPTPPDSPPAQPIVGWEGKIYWTPETGWAIAIVPKPGTEVPVPSA